MLVIHCLNGAVFISDNIKMDYSKKSLRCFEKPHNMIAYISFAITLQKAMQDGFRS